MVIDWKKFEQNKTINISIYQYIICTTQKKRIRVAYRSKYNDKRENQVDLLMITDGKKQHYLTLKSIPTADGYNCPIRSLSRLFRGIT